jgi:ABC-type phosphate/phosphonate transport system substrate-binding protein
MWLKNGKRGVVVSRMSSFILGIVVLVSVVIPRSVAQPPKPEPLPQVRIGFPEVLFKDVHKSLIQIAAQPFKEMIQKTAGMDGSLVIAQDYLTLASQLKAKQIDIAVFHGFEFAWIEKTDPDLIPLVITVPNCGKVQACLVVNSASQINEPKDLPGACIAVPKGSKAHCQMFLDRIRGSCPEGTCCPMQVPGMPPTSEEVLDDIASDNGKSKAALVDISALIAYQRDKPGLGSCLKILKESELLPSAVVVCRKGALTNEQIQAMKDGLLSCTKTAAGKAFVMFWSLKGFDVVNPKYFELLAKCREAYPPPLNPVK